MVIGTRITHVYPTGDKTVGITSQTQFFVDVGHALDGPNIPRHGSLILEAIDDSKTATEN